LVSKFAYQIYLVPLQRGKLARDEYSHLREKLVAKKLAAAVVIQSWVRGGGG
jgi:hypothetical protein